MVKGMTAIAKPLRHIRHGVQKRLNDERLKEQVQRNLLPEGLINILETLHDLYYFITMFFRRLFTRPFEIGETIKQCYHVGNRSLMLVGCTAFIMGVVLTLQSVPVMASYG